MNTKRRFEHSRLLQHDRPQGAVRTVEEVRTEFELSGISITAWAKEFGFSPSTVASVLRGDRGYRIGRSHQVAVALGIKAGFIVGDPKRV